MQGDSSLQGDFSVQDQSSVHDHFSVQCDSSLLDDFSVSELTQHAYQASLISSPMSEQEPHTPHTPQSAQEADLLIACARVRSQRQMAEQDDLSASLLASGRAISPTSTMQRSSPLQSPSRLLQSPTEELEQIEEALQAAKATKQPTKQPRGSRGSRLSMADDLSRMAAELKSSRQHGVTLSDKVEVLEKQLQEQVEVFEHQIDKDTSHEQSLSKQITILEKQLRARHGGQVVDQIQELVHLDTMREHELAHSEAVKCETLRTLEISRAEELRLQLFVVELQGSVSSLHAREASLVEQVHAAPLELGLRCTD